MFADAKWVVQRDSRPVWGGFFVIQARNESILVFGALRVSNENFSHPEKEVRKVLFEPLGWQTPAGCFVAR